METAAGLAIVALMAAAVALMAYALLRFMPGVRELRMPPPPGVDASARCETCGYYTWPAACPCVVAKRRADEEAGRPWSV